MSIPFLSGCGMTNISTTPILFYGDGCPHCANVETYMKEHIITLTQKEVYNNKSNATELGVYAAQCKIDKNNIGIPLLWTGKECFSGDTDIIEYLKKTSK